jgi:hypothetical protein
MFAVHNTLYITLLIDNDDNFVRLFTRWKYTGTLESTKHRRTPDYLSSLFVQYSFTILYYCAQGSVPEISKKNH